MSNVVYADITGFTSDDGFTSSIPQSDSGSVSDSIGSKRSQHRAKSPMSVFIANTIGQSKTVKLGKLMSLVALGYES